MLHQLFQWLGYRGQSPPAGMAEGFCAFELEPRLLFDGAALFHGVDILREAPVSPPTPARELVVVDPSVPDWRTLLKHVPRQAEVLTLDPRQDGFVQVADYLARHPPFAAMHLLSHGAPGSIQLGRGHLDAQTFKDYQVTMQQWSAGLTPGADVLVYGCNVGQGPAGNRLISQMSQTLGADVAASDNPTGADGDWRLERHAGPITTRVVIPATVQEHYTGNLATITVTSDIDGGTTSDGLVTLREAVSAANSNISVDGSTAGETNITTDNIVFDISLKNKTITLASSLTLSSKVSISGDFDGSGDDKADITISGNGGNFNAFVVSTVNANVSLNSLTIDNFDPIASDGGAVKMTAGSLTIGSSTFTNNSVQTGYKGGAISLASGISASITKSTLSGNSAPQGGAISIGNITAAISGCTITNNTATSQGGGLYIPSGSTTINFSTVSHNTASSGGGIYSAVAAADLTIVDTLIADNTGTNPDVSGAITAHYSLIEDVTGTTITTTTQNVTGQDPKLGSLMDHGGPTLTRALGAGSPALDKWLSSDVGLLVTVPGSDQRRNTFIREDNGYLDIGAYENHVPTAANNTLFTNEDTALMLTASNFNFNDMDIGDAVASVKITTTVSAGTMQYSNGSTWSTVTQNQVISKADLDLNRLRFTPAKDANGTGYATFGFSVSDGITSSASTYTMTMNVLAINDAPVSWVAQDARQFDGINDYLSIPLGSGLLSNIFTLEANVRFNAVDANVGNFLVLRESGGSNILKVQFTATGTLAVNTTPWGTLDSGITMNANQWYHVAVAYDGNANTAILSVNGLGTTFTSLASFGLTNTSQILYAGGDGSNVGVNFENLTLHDLRLWNTSRTTLEIQQNINRTLSQTTTGLQGYWLAINFWGTTATDRSPNGYTGTFVNMDTNIDYLSNLNLPAYGFANSYTVIRLTGWDVDNDPFSAYIKTLPAQGTLYQTSDGITPGAAITSSNTLVTDTSHCRVLYLPPTDYAGTDYSFTYVMKDASLESNISTVKLAILPANRPPTAANNTVTTDEDTTFSFGTGHFNFADLDGSPLNSVVITTLPAAGSLQYSSDGSTWSSVTQNQVISKASLDASRLRFTPAAHANGNSHATFGFKVNDGTDNSLSAYTMTVHVTPVNDVPTLTTVTTLSGTEDTGLTISYATLLAAADEADVEGSAISFQVQALTSGKLEGSQDDGVTWTTPVMGSTLFGAGSRLRWTPAAQAYGAAIQAFTIKAWDGTDLSASTVPVKVNVAAVNDAPTGNLGITGSAMQGQTLTVANTLADVEGLGTMTYQWKASGNTISGSTGSTLALTEALVGKTITVTASYTDGYGTQESVTSSVTNAVANVNDTPTGSVTLSGTASQGQMLTAANTLGDADGLGTISYQWLANGAPIGGATKSTLTLTEAQVGQSMAVRASYTDGHGTVENVTSQATLPVANVNDSPSGGITLVGTLLQGQTLVATHNLADLDGLGNITWQWRADGSLLNATGPTLMLTQSLVGKTISVTGQYTDGHNTLESVSTTMASPVGNVNDSPTGLLLAIGTAIEGQTLTATHNLADADGLGAIAYQWKANGADMVGATGSSLLLTETLVGKTISVTASYIDGFLISESVTSAATSPVAQLNNPPTLASPLADQSAAEDATFQWAIPGNSFADRDPLTYAATLADGSPLPAWLTFNPASRVLTGTPGNQDVATLAIRVTASDGTASVADIFNVTVSNTNDLPQRTSRPLTGPAVQVDQAFSFSPGSGLFADMDAGDTLSYQAQLAGGAPLPAWMRFDASSLAFAGTPVDGSAGTWNIQILATDSQGGQASDTFALVVAPRPFVPPPIQSMPVVAAAPVLSATPAALAPPSAPAMVVEPAGAAAVSQPAVVDAGASVSAGFAAPAAAAVAAPVAPVLANAPAAVDAGSGGSGGTVSAPTAPAGATAAGPAAGSAAPAGQGSGAPAAAAGGEVTPDGDSRSPGRAAGFEDISPDGGPTARGSGGSSGGGFAEYRPDREENRNLLIPANSAYSLIAPPVVVDGLSDRSAEKPVEGFTGHAAPGLPVVVEGFGDATATAHPAAAEGFGDTGTGGRQSASEGFGDSTSFSMSPHKAVEDGEPPSQEEEEERGETSTEQQDQADASSREHEPTEHATETAEEPVSPPEPVSRPVKPLGRPAFTAQLNAMGQEGFHRARMMELKRMIEQAQAR